MSGRRPTRHCACCSPGAPASHRAPPRRDHVPPISRRMTSEVVKRPRCRQWYRRVDALLEPPPLGHARVVGAKYPSGCRPGAVRDLVEYLARQCAQRDGVILAILHRPAGQRDRAGLRVDPVPLQRRHLALAQRQRDQQAQQIAFNGTRSRRPATAAASSRSIDPLSCSGFLRPCTAGQQPHGIGGIGDLASPCPVDNLPSAPRRWRASTPSRGRLSIRRWISARPNSRSGRCGSSSSNTAVIQVTSFCRERGLGRCRRRCVM